MALVAKRVNRKKKPPKRAKARRGTDRGRESAEHTLPEVSLATARSKPESKLGRYSVWLYGAPGIGKTSLAEQFPNAHLFMFGDDGAKALAAYQRRVKTWLEFVAYIDAFEKSRFRTAVIDIIEEAYQMCWDFMVDEVMDGVHPNDQNDFGKSWDRIYSEFIAQIKRLLSMPDKGVVFISHVSTKDVKTVTGEEWSGVHPNLRDKMLDRIKGIVDIIAYISTDGIGTKMLIRPDGYAMAKCRPRLNFRWGDTGKQIREFKLGASEEEAYENFYAAFHNKLDQPREKKFKKKKR